MSAVPPLAAFLRPELPPAALYGLPGEVATVLSESTGADPAAVLVSFLVLLGNAAGPQPHARFGGAEHPARLFAVLVGDAATGRKGTALEAVEPLLAEADPDWAGSRVAYGIQSGEAIVEQVADGGTDCRLMLVETEFARLAETMARTGTLSTHLRNAWDGRVMHRSGVRAEQRASRAHVSVLGMITPEELLRHHQRLSRAGGLESRILYCYSAPLREVSPFAARSDTADLAGRVRKALLSSREAVMSGTDPVSRHLLTLRGIQPRTEMPVSGSVRAAWRQSVKDRIPSSDGMPGLQSRAEAQVIRLSAAYALADMSPVIAPEHVEAALALQSYCARSAEVVFGIPVARLPPRVNPNVSARIVRALHDAYPGWVARDEIGSGLLHGNVPAVEVDAALRSLAVQRLVQHRRQPTDGRTRDEYRLIEPQLALFP